MVDIPKLYREKTINIDVGDGPVPIKIRSYTGADTEYTEMLNNCKAELPGLLRKVTLFKNIQNKIAAQKQDNSDITAEEYEDYFNSMKDDDLSDEDLDELMNATKEVNKLNGLIEVNSELLAQRGLKRAFYRDTEDYIEADIKNRVTEYIDSLPSIPEVPMEYLKEIANTMIELGHPSAKLIKAAGKGKPKQKRRSQSKKA